MATMVIKGKKMKSVDVDWKEFYYTNCPLISASNVDQELGWVRDELKKIGVEYRYLRSTRENDWYPHYVHNLDNLLRVGGAFPAIHVQADIRRTRLIGLCHVPYEGGCMMVRARDPIYRMQDLKGKKIGISKSQNVIKNDWWRVQEEQGIELMLKVNGMTRDDVELVDFPYADDWYDKPELLVPINNPNELWFKKDIKNELDFRPLEGALLAGKIDAIYTQSKVFQHLQEATGKLKAIEDLSRHPDWTLQGANIPATFTVTDVACEKHPELVVAICKGLLKVGRGANEHKHAAAVILNKGTYYLDVEDTCRGIQDMDMIPSLSPQNLAATEVNKDFMLSHGYIENDFDVQKWAAPEFMEQAAKEILEEEWKRRSQFRLPKRTSLAEAMKARLG